MKIKNEEKGASVYEEIASKYFYKNNIENEIKYYEKAIEIYMKTNNEVEGAMLYE